MCCCTCELFGKVRLVSILVDNINTQSSRDGAAPKQATHVMRTAPVSLCQKHMLLWLSNPSEGTKKQQQKGLVTDSPILERAFRARREILSRSQPLHRRNQADGPNQNQQEPESRSCFFINSPVTIPTAHPPKSLERRTRPARTQPAITSSYYRRNFLSQGRSCGS